MCRYPGDSGPHSPSLSKVCTSPGDRMTGATQQAQNICITFVQHRPNIFNAGPTLYKSYTNVLCVLGSQKSEQETLLRVATLHSPV